MSRTYKFLQPTYFDKFKCSGGDCKLNCCNYNWKIDVDKEIYKRYKKVNSEPLKTLLDKYIKRNRSSINDLNYAKLNEEKQSVSLNYSVLDENNKNIKKTGLFLITKCPFQTDDKLCLLHKDLGIDFLCNTCKVFPRNIANNNSCYEASLNCGCEEVSRLLFNQKNPIQFEIIEKSYENLSINFVYEGNILIDKIKTICLSILQFKKYSIENRVILLSIFLFKLNEIEKNFNLMDNFIDNFVQNISEYEKLFELNNIRHDLFLKLLLTCISDSNNSMGTIDLIKETQIMSMKLKNCLDTEDQLKLINLEIDGKEIYKFDENLTSSKSPLKSYKNGNKISQLYLKYKENIKTLMKDKEYYIENLLVNSFFNLKYCSSLEKNKLKEDSIKFVISYCFYMGYLTGFMCDDKDFDEEKLHTICTIWGRTCSDQLNQLNNLYNVVKEENLDTLAGMILFIKSC